jgi:hypothetical protein
VDRYIFNPDSGRPQVFSHGGGTQGSAICAMIASGRLPAPDVAVIADTGRESSPVWRYFDRYTKPALSAAGVSVIERLPHSFDGTGWNTVDIYGGKDRDTILMPMYTSSAGARREGMLPKYCSNEWKRRPVERFLRSIGITEADVWIGFSVDEATTRARFNPEAKFRDVYPLIEHGISRADCVEFVRAAGWPKPPRSACWQCPYRSKREWLEQRDHEPADHRAAIRLERELRKRDPHVYFHRSCVPLDRVDWNAEPDTNYEPGCQSGLCFT